MERQLVGGWVGGWGRVCEPVRPAPLAAAVVQCLLRTDQSALLSEVCRSLDLHMRNNRNLQALAAMWDHLLLRTPGEIASTVCSSVLTLMQVYRLGVTCTCVQAHTDAAPISGPQTRMRRAALTWTRGAYGKQTA